ncbi:hypothetical protein MD484_g6850, partial [Candolleomyces efflorescens]
MSSTIDFLFPSPSRPPAGLSPRHWPGVSPSSTKVLLEVLKHNHEHWHIFFNDQHFHNHAPHRSLALWAMGADGDVIRAGYEKDCGYEKPRIVSPGKISKENFTEHLGDERYYRGYLEFFEASLKHDGISHTLEEYLFSPSANVGVKEGLFDEDAPQPHMLARFFSGVVHPVIHAGYGLEFGLPGMLAEGLAQTAVQQAATLPLIPAHLFDSSVYSTLNDLAGSAGKALHDALGNTVSKLDAAFESKSLSKSPLNFMGDFRKQVEVINPRKPSEEQTLTGSVKAKVDPHALDILGWVSKDERFATPEPDPEKRESFDECIKKHSEAILQFSKLWKLDATRLGHDKRYLDAKIEELAFLVAVMYGVGGWTGRGKKEDGSEALFNADFFLMHLITSSAFIPSICFFISPTSQARFLQIYLTNALAYYVFRGCPPLDIVGFQTAKEPQPAGPQPHPDKSTLPSPESPKALNPDPWLPIIQTSVVHPDEHVPKTQRSLSNWAEAFGTRRFCSALKAQGRSASGGSDNMPSLEDAAASAGLGMGWGGESVQGSSLSLLGGENPIPIELDGAEYLDGTVFLRAAEMTAERLGRVREGEHAEFWDFKGFFDKDDRKEQADLRKALL